MYNTWTSSLFQMHFWTNLSKRNLASVIVFRHIVAHGHIICNDNFSSSEASQTIQPSIKRKESYARADYLSKILKNLSYHTFIWNLLNIFNQGYHEIKLLQLADIYIPSSRRFAVVRPFSQFNQSNADYVKFYTWKLLQMLH